MRILDCPCSNAALILLALATSHDLTAQTQELSFRPKFSVKWPGKPSEHSQVLQTELGEEKHYSAMFADKSPSGSVLYFAAVEELPKKALKEFGARKLLEAYVFAFKKEETSRKEITFGKGKYPALDITTHARKLFGRRLVILAGNRIYDVSVTSSDEQALKAPQVKAFFESFIPEKEPLATRG